IIDAGLRDAAKARATRRSFRRHIVGYQNVHRACPIEAAEPDTPPALLGWFSPKGVLECAAVVRSLPTPSEWGVGSIETYVPGRQLEVLFGFCRPWISRLPEPSESRMDSPAFD